MLGRAPELGNRSGIAPRPLLKASPTEPFASDA